MSSKCHILSSPSSCVNSCGGLGGVRVSEKEITHTRNTHTHETHTYTHTHTHTPTRHTNTHQHTHTPPHTPHTSHTRRTRTRTRHSTTSPKGLYVPAHRPIHKNRENYE